MRIIAGEFRSRQILAPKTDATRPITDRVKQSLFDILSPSIEAAHVYDCFAGTGSMGLECLSRGAAFATFFEADKSATTLLRQNVAALGVQKRSRIVDRDLFRWFQSTAAPTKLADLIFLDPPYRIVRENAEQLRTVVDRIVSFHLTDAGAIIFRHDSADRLEFSGLRLADQRDYGGMTIELLVRA